MSDLTDFLLARIAEDHECAEAVARQWLGDQQRSDPWSLTASDEYDVLHIEVDPAHVLAECQAKRSIVEWCNASIAGFSDEGEKDLARTTLSELALPYADHPDFREEWRP